MKVFIDLGAYDGDTLLKAQRKFKEVNRFIGFEPAHDIYLKLVKRVGYFAETHNKAASIKEGITRLYLSEEQMGHSLLSSKRNVRSEYVEVESIDFIKFLDQFNEEDEIILKIDIEGEEYNILPSLLESSKIKLIKRIFCEWHYHKIGLAKEVHNELVKKLQNKGYKLTGNNIHDEFKE